jgi:hypothetical protein
MLTQIDCLFRPPKQQPAINLTKTNTGNLIKYFLVQ